jgi:hypothetical protein
MGLHDDRLPNGTLVKIKGGRQMIIRESRGFYPTKNGGQQGWSYRLEPWPTPPPIWRQPWGFDVVNEQQAVKGGTQKGK